LRGTLALGKGMVAPTTGAIFISVRPMGPDGEAVKGMPIAAERIDLAAFPLAFEITERNLMIAGAQFQGDVVIEARADQDSDAISRQPGDILGTAKAKIPAEKIAIELNKKL